ncbi:protein kinase domain protein [Ichthyophthirius multifiliis]|uniref:non-specific serine/threonine protein kinase n=1 Tax=Ichthyophthirius multifiliis TaxID=5932 RepID=G0R6M7_ICHMU|nr:protein kinase domain protein [Ichthyophthirius multifiliis]EGR26879.1 protein kinase domain protein [Ichthyophthirius multifiliis]|eukprot:XP_004023763.1 protein kinase domain protein [Ichthyophthirius multifiliis]
MELAEGGDLIMLGDLNLSKKITSNGFLYTQAGTPYYSSPEIWNNQPYDYKSDIWSLGCIIYEMCALKPPFRGNDMEELNKKIQKGIYEPIPNHYSFNLSYFIQKLLN